MIGMLSLSMQRERLTPDLVPCRRLEKRRLAPYEKDLGSRASASRTQSKQPEQHEFPVSEAFHAGDQSQPSSALFWE